MPCCHSSCREGPCRVHDPARLSSVPKTLQGTKISRAWKDMRANKSLESKAVRHVNFPAEFYDKPLLATRASERGDYDGLDCTEGPLVLHFVSFLSKVDTS